MKVRTDLPPFPVELLTPRLRLSAVSFDRAEALHAALLASTDHLRPWLPWARREPQSMEMRRAFVGECVRSLEFRIAANYLIVDRHSDNVLGGIGLHRRIGEGAGEIGYWIRADSVNRGYATEAAAALTHSGFEQVGMLRLEIQCDSKNSASARVPRKLGYQLQAQIQNRMIDATTEARDTMIWGMGLIDYQRRWRENPAFAAFVSQSTASR